MSYAICKKTYQEWTVSNGYSIMCFSFGLGQGLRTGLAVGLELGRSWEGAGTVPGRGWTGAGKGLARDWEWD